VKHKATGIEVAGGILVTEVRKHRERNLRYWIRVASLLLANRPVSWADGPVDVVIWSVDRTAILYREGPFLGPTLGYYLQQFVQEINRDGLDVFISNRRKERA
jgi:hypothetical protein